MARNSLEVPPAAVGEPDNWVHDDQSSKNLDAGAMFVLKSRGSWLHSGYHLTTSIVGPVIFTLPFTFGALGWVGGMMCLSLVGLITFYSYLLLSIVLEHYATRGHRLLRFRDMGNHILGPGWGKYLVGPLQFAICYGAVIVTILLGGQSLKFIYLLYQPTGKIQLYQFIIIFATVPLLMAQIPSFHSLRHINLLSLVLCLAYSACTVAGAIHIGTSKSAPDKDYSTIGSQGSRVLNAVNGISIIATTYGCGIIPEIQIYLQPTNELLENWFADAEKDQFSLRNVVPRLFSRSFTVIVATIVAAMFPFFGDIMALFGAFAIIPIDFILPMIFYSVTFKPSKQSLAFWVNTLILVVSSGLVALGAVASVRQIALDAKKYSLFANM